MFESENTFKFIKSYHCYEFFSYYIIIIHFSAIHFIIPDEDFERSRKHSDL